MPSFPVLQRRSQQVLSVLRKRLEQQDIAHGTRLPPERALATELNVSRRVLREALQILEDDGVIKRIPGRGTVIVNETGKGFDRTMDDIRQYTSPVELMDARFALEPAIAAMAAAHATSHDIDEMRRYIDKTTGVLRDPKEWEKWDSALHAAMGRATRNNILVRFYEMLTAAREQTAWGRLRKASLTPERQALYVEQHASIVSAIEERDPELAAQRMRAHLSTVRRTMIHQLDDA